MLQKLVTDSAIQYEFANRKYRQFGIDVSKREIYLNHKTTAEFLEIHLRQLYRNYPDRSIARLGDKEGEWFLLSEAFLNHIHPLWFVEYLKESMQLLDSFYLAKPKNYGVGDCKGYQAIANLWDDQEF